MLRKRWILLLAAAAMLLATSSIRFAAQHLPGPARFRGEVSRRPVPPPEGATRANAWLGLAPERIATSSQWVDRDRLDLRVYQNKKPVALAAGFHDLVTVTPADPKTDFDRLLGKAVAIVPSEKHSGQWEVYLGVGGVDTLTLAGNIFKVQQVLVSSRENPLALRVDGELHQLKPGQALLIM